MKRRAVQFATLDEILDDVRHLHEVGYDRAGNWSLGQICMHLSYGIDMSIEVRIPRWFQRLYVACFFRLMFLGTIGNALGLRLPTGAPPKGPTDDDVGIARLEKEIARLKASENEPLTRLHLFHCGHHLSFLIPREPPA